MFAETEISLALPLQPPKTNIITCSNVPIIRELRNSINLCSLKPLLVFFMQLLRRRTLRTFRKFHLEYQSYQLTALFLPLELFPNDKKPSRPMEINATKKTAVVTPAPITPAAARLSVWWCPCSCAAAALAKTGLLHVPQPRSCWLLHAIHHWAVLFTAAGYD